MFKKALTESGKRILKVIKKFSTRTKSGQNQKQNKIKKSYYNEVTCDLSTSSVPAWTATYLEPEIVSLSWSLHSLDAKSIDTYVTYVTEAGLDECNSICSYCTSEHENRWNENLENEMII